MGRTQEQMDYQVLEERTFNRGERRIEIDGIVYDVIQERDYQYYGREHTQLYLQRPKGKIYYFSVRYDNGAFATVSRI
jgi:hypothetical protein